MVRSRQAPWIHLLASCLATALLAVGCSGGGDDDDAADDDDDDGCDPIAANLSALQTAIFTPNCALSSCHGATGPASNLSLASGQTYGETVGVDAVQTFNGNTVKLVQAGDKDASYLYLKVAGTTGITPSQMPAGNPALCQEKIDAIGAWIDAGAAND